MSEDDRPRPWVGVELFCDLWRVTYEFRPGHEVWAGQPYKQRHEAEKYAATIADILGGTLISPITTT